jgi:hypothetical protein
VNLRLIVTILVIAAAPVCAQAQKPTPAKVTKADAQKVLKIISSDKAKTRIYCQMAKLGDQMEQANETGDSKKFDRLFQRIYELGKKLGPEYAALVDGLQDIDPQSEVGQAISSTLDALDNLWGGNARWNIFCVAVKVRRKPASSALGVPFKNCGISSVLATGSRRSISASLCFLAISSPFVSIGATLQVDLLRQRAY